MTIDADQLAQLNATRDLHGLAHYVRPIPTHNVHHYAENAHLFGGHAVTDGVLDRRLGGTRLPKEAVD